MNPFQQADGFSDKILDLINAEIKKPGFDPVQIYLGMLMAVYGYMRTCPEPRPVSMDAVMVVIDHCLHDAFNAYKGKTHEPLSASGFGGSGAS